VEEEDWRAPEPDTSRLRMLPACMSPLPATPTAWCGCNWCAAAAEEEEEEEGSGSPAARDEVEEEDEVRAPFPPPPPLDALVSAVVSDGVQAQLLEKQRRGAQAHGRVCARANWR
jgi:hypothetical protein